MDVMYVVVAIVAAVIGAALALLFAAKSASGKLTQAKSEADQVLDGAK